MFRHRQIFQIIAFGFLLTSLQVYPSFAQQQTVSGIVVAEEIAEISLPRAGTIDTVHVTLGQTVSKETRLVSLECSEEQSQLAVAQAEQKIAKNEYSIQQKRAANGSGGKASVTRAKGQLDLTTAQIQSVETLLSQCQISAPFGGVISDVSVRAHEAAVAGQPLLTLLNTKRLRLEIILPAEWLSEVSVGTKFNFVSSTDAVDYTAKITVISPRVDPVSQTVLVYAKFVDDQALPLAGSAGLAHFDTD